MNDNKDEVKPKVWKLEGEAFEKVKVAKEAYRAAQAEAERIFLEAHKKLWDTIHESAPEIEKWAKLSLDTQYEDAGFYVVKPKPNPLASLLDPFGKDKKADEAA